MQTAHAQLVQRSVPPYTNANEHPVVIVGAGPVGVRALKVLRESAPHLPVVMFGDERFEPYNRVQLSNLLAGRTKLPDLRLGAEWLGSNDDRVQFIARRVVAIDTQNKTVRDDQGAHLTYRSLILATGSRPFVPALPGTDLKGVYTFRDMADAERLAARRVLSTRTVVLGAGLLGIEAACGMQRYNTQVALVDHNAHPMYRQLDSEAGGLLSSELIGRGINLHLNASIRMLLGTSAVEGVVLRDGSQLACDTVVLATGITPNRTLAEQAGLAFGRGITVDEHMLTSAPDVYAVGECCEFQGEIYGIVAPGLEQASIAVRHLLGGDAQGYRKPQLATSLKVAGLSVFGLGDPQPKVSLRTHTYKADGVYRRVTLFGGHIHSVNAIGDWSELPALRELAEKRRWISPVRLWRFRATGLLFGESNPAQVSQWPATAIVCNCNSVSCGEIREVVGAGAESIAAITARTQAGGSCGSCQPLLQELLSSDAPREAPKGGRWLTGGSVAAGVVGIVAVAFSLGYPQTVQLDWRWDQLWRDNWFKQVSGFTILGLSLLSVLFSFRKRLTFFKAGDFAWWRIAHIALTGAALCALAVHTGFRLGSNLNMMLMLTFLGLVLAGAMLGTSIAMEGRLAPARAHRLRSYGIWGHVLMAWPLPALLGAHVFKTYYF